MRRITKTPIPPILEANKDNWTNEYLAEPTNSTKKYRYRHKDIKSALVAETSNKCVYCESKIGHNTPGDVEHKVPSSVDQKRHFEWANLTIACTECNRRKNDYYSAMKPFLDPYADDVEARIVHHGPISCWALGDENAELTVRTLELNEMGRTQLVSQKVEAIDKLNNVVARMANGNELIKELMALRIQKMKSIESEYSGMINAICNAYGI